MTTMVGALTGACLTVLLVTTTAMAAPVHTVTKGNNFSFDSDPYSTERLNLVEPLEDRGPIPTPLNFTGKPTVKKETAIGGAAMKMAMDGASMVKKTVPSDGTSMSRSPKEIRITFAHPARLAVLRLTTIAGEVIPVEFRQPEETSTEVVVALPELDPEDYSVHWRAHGDDGHVMSGSFSFSISRQ